MSAFKIVRTNCCGIDVHKSFVMACVAKTDSKNITSYQTERFSTTTCELERLAAWLKEMQCTEVCMESTGKYWIPVYNILEPTCKIVLAHPKYTKALRGKKTDKRDAKWITDVFMVDMVRGSLIPPKDIRTLRDIMRYGKKITQQSTSEKNRAQNCLTVCNFKLDEVFSDVFGMASTAIMNELCIHPTGDFDVAPFISGRCKTPISKIQDAIQGNLTEDQRAKLQIILSRIKVNEVSKAGLNQIITPIIEKYRPQLALLMTIPGVKEQTALTIISEIGVDMSQFRSGKTLASWAGLTPQNNESGGKKRTTRISRAGTYLKPVLVQWANSLCKSKKYPEISGFYMHVMQHRGHKKAIIALCRKLVMAVYSMLSEGTAYDPSRFSNYSGADITTGQAKQIRQNNNNFANDCDKVGDLEGMISIIKSLGYSVCDRDGVVV